MHEQTENTDMTKDLARRFTAGLIPNTDRATLIALSGELGAGKTTFIQGIGDAFGVIEPMQSPTFVIMKIYKLKHSSFDHLIHVDAYRLESADELLRLGWRDECANPRNVICIEWPERVAGAIPADATMITFAHGGHDVRDITIGVHDKENR